jgi:hypothetical protein
MATIAHRVEVEVGADGPASAPHSGAAAAAPPAGASFASILLKIMIDIHSRTIKFVYSVLVLPAIRVARAILIMVEEFSIQKHSIQRNKNSR